MQQLRGCKIRQFSRTAHARVCRHRRARDRHSPRHSVPAYHACWSLVVVGGQRSHSHPEKNTAIRLLQRQRVWTILQPASFSCLPGRHERGKGIWVSFDGRSQLDPSAAAVTARRRQGQLAIGWRPDPSSTQIQSYRRSGTIAGSTQVAASLHTLRDALGRQRPNAGPVPQRRELE